MEELAEEMVRSDLKQVLKEAERIYG